MSRRIVMAALLCTGAASACGGGGGSGISGSKSLVSLGDGEIEELCEYLVEADGPERMIDCGSGHMITAGGVTLAECIADFQRIRDAHPSCTATVSNAEQCAEDFAAFTDQELCSGPLPPSCQFTVSSSCSNR